MKASELDLIGAAKAGAEALERRFPGIVFTSGRRKVADQARAMASNVVKNRHWIFQTYAAQAEKTALQGWIDRHPEADTHDEIAQGLASVMFTWSTDQLCRLSSHFSGKAFDVRPETGDRAPRMVAAIRALPGLDKFLEREGGLIRWHAQFH